MNYLGLSKKFETEGATCYIEWALRVPGTHGTCANSSPDYKLPNGTKAAQVSD